MKNTFLFVFAICCLFTSTANAVEIVSPDGNLKIEFTDKDGSLYYDVFYDGKAFLNHSPLGMKTNWGDFTEQLSITGHEVNVISESYTLKTIKRSSNQYDANELILHIQNENGQKLNIIFRVSNNDIAFCYELPRQNGKTSVKVSEEITGFKFPLNTTTFLTPQSDAMIGWKRTKPSYEEPYQADMPMDAPSMYGHGYTFPGLFRLPEKGWILISETGVDGRYCASRLSEYQSDGLYQVAFPMMEENDGNGTVAPAFALPGNTPWRTITIGENLKPIVETTIPWDVVKPLYETAHDYHSGKGVWSWILWQDNSINYDDQVKYIDFASEMGYPYALIDNWWDKNIGHKRMETLIRYAASKNVGVILWYSSSGYWNDIEQSPRNMMDDPIIRKREMKWLQSQGVKGIKVDFFGGDKQTTMRLYEAILSDADDHGLMVDFHGATIPRGWERMFPNYIGSEAVLASENMVFMQEACDNEAFNATLHPFIRNAIGSMEFGGTFLNKRLNKNNNGGTIRKTTDVFEIATAVLFQNPAQFFALAPNNLTDANPLCIGFMKNIPTTWDETRFIDGYPGKYVILARRHGDQWYVAGINAEKETKVLNVKLPFPAGKEIKILTDDKQKNAIEKVIKAGKNGTFKIDMIPKGGFVAVL